MRAPFLVACLALTHSALAQPPAAADARKAVPARVNEVLGSIKNETDFESAKKSLEQLFDEVIAFAPASDLDSYREASFGLRLVSQVSQAKEGTRVELLGYLKANDALARALVFTVRPEDKPAGVYALLDRLRAHHKDLGQFASLVAALCVVHDQPLTQRVNENKVSSPDAVEIFDYFKSGPRQVTSMPPELLISVVDVTCSIEELRWAKAKFGSDTRIGQRYFDVKYDISAFRKGTDKKVTLAGFTLQNILTHGGVCADQAYFATQVGKAQAIPTAFVTGRNAEVAHAWVGFLDTQGGKAAWNFDTGRYSGYQGVRGETLDPQTRTRIPDSALALMAEATTSNANARRAATAMTDAALRLTKLEGSATYPPAEAATVKAQKQARTTAIASRLELLEAGLRQCPSYAPGWGVLVEFSKGGELSLKDKKRWGEVLDRLCAGKYPDFSLDVLRPMVETVEDVKDQDALWNSLASGFNKRPDLSAEIRFAQGAMWEESKDRSRAWDCYQDVIRRFANDGPFTVGAARRCERLLKDGGKNKDITPMYADLWARLAKPQDMAPEFRMQSNWFQIGSLYASRLDADGQGVKARDVRDTLGIPREGGSSNAR